MNEELKQNAEEKSDTIKQTEKHTKTENRLIFMDNLRIFLTILVIMHHSAITYGASGSWMYVEPSNMVSIILLSWFTAINQSFFMGIFFMLSGYFIPISLERKGIKLFKRDRLIRLGIPLLVYTFLLNYLAWWMLAVTVDGIDISFPAFILQQLVEINVSTGPMWFNLNLLIFTYGYILIHQIMKAKKHDYSRTLDKITINSRTIALFAFSLGLITFIVRILFPQDYRIPLIEGLGLQIGNGPQYLIFFIIGILASQQKWFEKITKKHAMQSLFITIFVGIGLILFALGIGIFDNYSGPNTAGGFNWVAFSFSMIEAFLGVNITVVLIVSFRDHFNQQNRVAKAMSVNAYTAYIIHPLVVVGLTLILRNLNIFPLFKWIILSIPAIILCFLCSALIRKIPKITRILG